MRTSAPVRMTWARLLKRVFEIHIEHCACGGKLKLVAVIEESAVIERILTHVGLSPQPRSRTPARRVDLFQGIETRIRTGFYQGWRDRLACAGVSDKCKRKIMYLRWIWNAEFYGRRTAWLKGRQLTLRRGRDTLGFMQNVRLKSLSPEAGQGYREMLILDRLPQVGKRSASLCPGR